MIQDTIDRLTAELREEYSGAVGARDGGLTLLRLPEICFPPGCQPTSTNALVVFDPNKPKAELYLKVVPSVRGAQPQHGTSTIGGETWYTYSYNLCWTEQHTALQFVEGMVRRFA